MKGITRRNLEALVFATLASADVKTHRDLEYGIEFVVSDDINLMSEEFNILFTELRELGVSVTLRGCAFWDGPAGIELTISWGPDDEQCA